ncbi:restriction endonuclease subunit S [Enterobacter quasiroggenkampii]|uniref:Restriction endonuclease subunit S n=1 Tax=Enterobacter quasiroggenkampii TaxID=2497436 RepID=A0ABY8E2A1_9ENTR|nr:restriction endonuclease subunit S [Enterobacter quasiroggenkampii]WFC83170.1 restriction endonuclease subunit S [Enterobacter quasiroggenkampii]
MGSKWKTSFLTDHYIISSGLSKPAKDFGTGYPFLSFKDIFYNYFLPDSFTQLVQSTDKERASCSVRRGDVFLTRTSETMHELGMSSVALKDYTDATFNGFCKRLRPKETSELEPEYVGYYLRSPIFRQSMLAFSTMSTRASLNNEMISRLEISYPDRKIQKKIANILLSLDEKIAISRAINQTLEQMSQTLFKSWFVDFDPVIDNALDAGNPVPEALQSRAELRQKVRNSADFKPLPADIRALFPAEFEETELGWVPKGWITTSFNDLIELIGGGTPKTSVEQYWNGDIPWFSVVDAPSESDVYVLTTEKNITTEGLINSSAKLLRKGTTIISARGTVGKCAMVAVPMAMNQSCYGVIGKNNVPDEYIYFQLKNAVQTLQQMGHGSVFNTITRDTFKNIKVPFCNEELTNSYSLLVKNYFAKILNNNYQNIALTNLRDTLLPKLISGELSLEDLPDLIKQTEAA